MSPRKGVDSSDAESGRNSGSESDSSRGTRSRSGSPTGSIHQVPVATPGYSLEQHSRSNSPVQYGSQNPQSPIHSPRSSPHSHHGEGSSPVSRKSHSSPNRSAQIESRSSSPNLQIDAGSNRSDSPADSHKSGKSDTHKSLSSPRSRENSASPALSQKSNISRQSRSSSHSPVGSRKSRSYSRTGSQKSGSPASIHSPASVRSHRSHSRSNSGSRKSRSKSPAGSEHSAASHRGVSKSPTGKGSRSPSPAGSHVSNRSDKSHKSNKSDRSHKSNKSDRSHKSVKSDKSEKSGKISSPLKLPDDSGSDIEGDKTKRKRDDLSGGSGSDSGKIEKKKHKSAVIDTDSSEDERSAKDPVTADALFGDADDISSEEEKEKEDADRTDDRKSDSESDRRRDSDRGRDSDKDDDRRRSSDDEVQRRPMIEDDEEREPEPEPIPETRIDVEIPKITTDLGRDLHFVKLPNFLSVETRPFDKDTYEDEIDEEETLDEEGRARLKLKVENTIRWRDVVDKSGNIIKESNARIVKWSDGSMSLHLGGEIFDVYRQPLQGDHNHLFIRQGTGLQGQAVFRNKLTFRPHSTESFTHRKMTMSLADRSQKTSGIKILSQVGADPDQDRKWNLKKEEEKLRQAMRTTKPSSKPKRSRDPTSHTAYRDQDEGSDDEGAISIAAIKNKFIKKAGSAAAAGSGKTGAIYSSDEDGSDFEGRKSKKTDKSKALKDSDEESDEDDHEDESGDKVADDSE